MNNFMKYICVTQNRDDPRFVHNELFDIWLRPRKDSIFTDVTIIHCSTGMRISRTFPSDYCFVDEKNESIALHNGGHTDIIVKVTYETLFEEGT